MEMRVLDETTAENWTAAAPELALPQLDNLERDGVSIQCVNSSDFVIGRQTNFNGPVTIITCADVLRQRNQQEEEFVIRDKVLSQSAAMKVQKLADEKPENGGDQDVAEDSSKFGKYKKPFWIFGLVCVVLLTAASIALIVLPITPAENPLPNCTVLPSNYCMFSNFNWGGRQTSTPLKPLQTPVSHVIISQTYQDFCYEIPACLDVIYQMQTNMTDENICNFYVGGDGHAYEDLGWSWECSLEGPAAREKVLQICFMGNYSEEELVTYPQIKTAKALIQTGVESDYISREYILAASNATSPAKDLGSIYKMIKKWPNFSEDPFSLRPNFSSLSLVTRQNVTNPNC